MSRRWLKLRVGGGIEVGSLIVDRGFLPRSYQLGRRVRCPGPFLTTVEILLRLLKHAAVASARIAQ